MDDLSNDKRSTLRLIGKRFVKLAVGGGDISNGGISGGISGVVKEIIVVSNIDHIEKDVCVVEYDNGTKEQMSTANVRRLLKATEFDDRLQLYVDYKKRLRATIIAECGSFPSKDQLARIACIDALLQQIEQENNDVFVSSNTTKALSSVVLRPHRERKDEQTATTSLGDAHAISSAKFTRRKRVRRTSNSASINYDYLIGKRVVRLKHRNCPMSAVCEAVENREGVWVAKLVNDIGTQDVIPVGAMKQLVKFTKEGNRIRNYLKDLERDLITLSEYDAVENSPQINRLKSIIDQIELELQNETSDNGSSDSDTSSVASAKSTESLINGHDCDRDNISILPPRTNRRGRIRSGGSASRSQNAVIDADSSSPVEDGQEPTNIGNRKGLGQRDKGIRVVENASRERDSSNSDEDDLRYGNDITDVRDGSILEYRIVRVGRNRSMTSGLCTVVIDVLGRRFIKVTWDDGTMEALPFSEMELMLRRTISQKRIARYIHSLRSGTQIAVDCEVQFQVSNPATLIDSILGEMSDAQRQKLESDIEIIKNDKASWHPNVDDCVVRRETRVEPSGAILSLIRSRVVKKSHYQTTSAISGVCTNLLSTDKFWLAEMHWDDGSTTFPTVESARGVRDRSVQENRLQRYLENLEAEVQKKIKKLTSTSNSSDRQSQIERELKLIETIRLEIGAVSKPKDPNNLESLLQSRPLLTPAKEAQEQVDSSAMSAVERHKEIPAHILQASHKRVVKVDKSHGFKAHIGGKSAGITLYDNTWWMDVEWDDGIHEEMSAEMFINLISKTTKDSRLKKYRRELSESMKTVFAQLQRDPSNRELVAKYDRLSSLLKTTSEPANPEGYLYLGSRLNQSEATGSSSESAIESADPDECPQRLQLMLKQRIVKYVDKRNHDAMLSGQITKAVKKHDSWHVVIEWDDGRHEVQQMEAARALLSRTKASNRVKTYSDHLRRHIASLIAEKSTISADSSRSVEIAMLIESRERILKELDSKEGSESRSESDSNSDDSQEHVQSDELALTAGNHEKIAPRFQVLINARIVKYLESGENAAMISSIPKSMFKVDRRWVVRLVADNGTEEIGSADSILKTLEKSVAQNRLSRYLDYLRRSLAVECHSFRSHDDRLSFRSKREALIRQIEAELELAPNSSSSRSPQVHRTSGESAIPVDASPQARGITNLPSIIEYVSRGKVKFFNGTVVRACTSCHKHRGIFACRLEFGHREGNWDDTNASSRNNSKKIVLTKVEVDALEQVSLSESRDARGHVVNSARSSKDQSVVNSRSSGQRGLRSSGTGHDDVGNNDDHFEAANDSNSESGRGDNKCLLGNAKDLTCLGEILLHALATHPEINCALPTEEGKESQIAIARDYERKRQIDEWCREIVMERADLYQTCEKIIATDRHFNGDDKHVKSKTVIAATEYQESRDTLIPQFSAYISAVTDSSRPVLESVTDAEVSVLRASGLHHAVANELDLQSATHSAGDSGHADGENSFLRSILATVDAHVQTRQQLQSARDTIGTRRRLLLARTEMCSSAIVHSQVRTDSLLKRRLECQESVQQKLEEHVQNIVVLEMEELELIEKLNRVRKDLEVAREQKEDIQRVGTQELLQIDRKLELISDSAARCVDELENCSVGCSLLDEFEKYVRSLTGLAVPLHSSTGIMGFSPPIDLQGQYVHCASVLSRITKIVGKALQGSACTDIQTCVHRRRVLIEGLELCVNLLTQHYEPCQARNATDGSIIYPKPEVMVQKLVSMTRDRLIQNSTQTGSNTAKKEAENSLTSTIASLSYETASSKEIVGEVEAVMNVHDPSIDEKRSEQEFYASCLRTLTTLVEACRSCAAHLHIPRINLSVSTLDPASAPNAASESFAGTTIVLCDPRTVKHLVPSQMPERSVRIVKIMQKLLLLQETLRFSSSSSLSSYMAAKFSIPGGRPTNGFPTEDDGTLSIPIESGDLQSKRKMAEFVHEIASGASKRVRLDDQDNVERNDDLIASLSAGNYIEIIDTNDNNCNAPQISLGNLQCLLVDDSFEVPKLFWDCVRLAHADSYVKFVEARYSRVSESNSNAGTLDRSVPLKGFGVDVEPSTEELCSCIFDSDSESNGSQSQRSINEFSSTQCLKTVTPNKLCQPRTGFITLCGECSNPAGLGWWECLEDNSSDTYISRESFDAAIAASVVVCRAVEGVFSGRITGYEYMKDAKLDTSSTSFGSSRIKSPKTVQAPSDTLATKVCSAWNRQAQFDAKVIATRSKRGSSLRSQPIRPDQLAILPVSEISPINARPLTVEATGPPPATSELIKTLKRVHFRPLSEFSYFSELSSMDKAREEAWLCHFEGLLDYGSVKGTCNVPFSTSWLLPDGRTVRLGRWLAEQRTKGRRNELTPQRHERLQILSNNRLFSWEMVEGNWVFGSAPLESTQELSPTSSNPKALEQNASRVESASNSRDQGQHPKAGSVAKPDYPTPTTVEDVTNAFCCIRPPGHHSGRYGSTRGCTQNGFCLLNNVAIGAYFARVCYGVKRIAIVDIDAHFGNGTLEIFEHDPNVFYASVHLQRDDASNPFFPSVPTILLGADQELPNRVLVNVYPPVRASNPLRELPRPRGRKGFLSSFQEKVLPALEKFRPELIFVSAGFDGAATDPIGSSLGLLPSDFFSITEQLKGAVSRIMDSGMVCKLVSVLEGGYDVDRNTDGLGMCVEAHVTSLCNRKKPA